MKKSFKEVCQEISWHPHFWDPTKLLTKRDRNGLEPGIFAAISNRTGGKTYGIAQVLLKYNQMTGGEIGLICKTQTDLGMIGQGVLGAVLRDKYPSWTLVENVSKTKRFSELILRRNLDPEDKDAVEERRLGFVFALNAAAKLKDYSSLFVGVDVLFMDEFQGDTYLSKEVDKLILLVGSVARGGEEGVRYVPLIMCSNSLSIENPYFVAWGIVSKIQSDTKFYRGDGLVLERFTNEYSAKAQRESAFIRAFSGADMVKCSVDNSWLNDDYSCIAKPEKSWGRSVYIATLEEGENRYGVRRYDNGFFYINRSFDESCPTVYAISVDGVENAPLLRTGAIFQTLIDRFRRGRVRFSDLSVKNLIYKFFI